MSGIKPIKILFKFPNRLPESGVTLLLSKIRITLVVGLSQGFFGQIKAHGEKRKSLSIYLMFFAFGFIIPVVLSKEDMS